LDKAGNDLTEGNNDGLNPRPVRRGWARHAATTRTSASAVAVLRQAILQVWKQSAEINSCSSKTGIPSGRNAAHPAARLQNLPRSGLLCEFRAKDGIGRAAWKGKP
jgi:hypothetical protein